MDEGVKGLGRKGFCRHLVRFGLYCQSCGGDVAGGGAVDGLPWNESNPEWWRAQVQERGEYAWAWLVNEWGRRAMSTRVEMAARTVAGVPDDQTRDDDTGVCVYCEGGWEMVPGPRGGKPKWKHMGTHHPGCPLAELRAAVWGYKSTVEGAA